MSHQSADPLWLCRIGGHGRDRGHDCHVDVVHTRILQADFVQLLSPFMGQFKASFHALLRMTFNAKTKRLFLA